MQSELRQVVIYPETIRPLDPEIQCGLLKQTGFLLRRALHALLADELRDVQIFRKSGFTQNDVSTQSICPWLSLEDDVGAVDASREVSSLLRGRWRITVDTFALLMVPSPSVRSPKQRASRTVHEQEWCPGVSCSP